MQILRVVVTQRRNFPIAMEKARYRDRGPLYSPYALSMRMVRGDHTVCAGEAAIFFFFFFYETMSAGWQYVYALLGELSNHRLSRFPAADIFCATHLSHQGADDTQRSLDLRGALITNVSL